VEPDGGFFLRDVPDMAPEEHRRRGEAAAALFREMKRQIAAKIVKDRI
jgi:hypothetical protein